MERTFAAYARINVCEAYEDQMGHAITGHD